MITATHRLSALGLLERVKKAAATESAILIQGETGSENECIAFLLHQLSARSGSPFVTQHCAAMPADMLESELFGRNNGALAGDCLKHKGALAAAGGGILFIDEIGSLNHTLQTKLLGAIEESVHPEASGDEVTLHPRIFSSTTKDLRECIKQHKFREDLYYRVAAVILPVQPLREQREDIIPLARYFVGLASQWSRTLTPEAEERLRNYDWPGSLNELRSSMEHAVTLADGDEIQSSVLSFPTTVTAAGQTSQSLAYVEQRHILHVLKYCGGNKSDAAKALGLARSTLVLKLKTFSMAQT